MIFLQPLLPFSSNIYQLYLSPSLLPLCQLPFSLFSVHYHLLFSPFFSSVGISAFFFIFVSGFFKLWFIFSVFSLHLSSMPISSTTTAFAGNYMSSSIMLYLLLLGLPVNYIQPLIYLHIQYNTRVLIVTAEHLTIFIYKHLLACMACQWVRITSLLACWCSCCMAIGFSLAFSFHLLSLYGSTSLHTALFAVLSIVISFVLPSDCLLSRLYILLIL